MNKLKTLNWITITELTGIGCITIGCFLIASFVGFIATGISLLLFSVALGRGRTN